MKNGFKSLILVLAVFLLVGCGVNEEKKVVELSLDDNVVKTIIKDFSITPSMDGEINKFDYRYPRYEEATYANEELSDVYMYHLAFGKALNLIKEDNECDTSKYGDGQGTSYICHYINYSDLNKAYKDMFGNNLPKSTIRIILTDLVYDSENDVYRICSIAAGGGSDEMDATEVVKAEQEGDYIYIYEKVAFVWPTNFDLTQFEIVYPKNPDNPKDVGNYKYAEVVEKVKEQYIDTFETYKWTFKKNENGNYVYQSLEYVK